MLERLEKAVSDHRTAEEQLREANCRLRETQRNLGQAMLSELGPEQALNTGVFTVNIAKLRHILYQHKQ